MLEGCAARAGLATGELSDVMKIQAQIIGSLIRKAAVEVSLHPARIQGSEAKGAVCGEHRNESTPWRKRPRSGFGAWCVLLPPRVAQHYAEQPTSPTRDHAKERSMTPPKHVAFKCPHKFVPPNGRGSARVRPARHLTWLWEHFCFVGAWVLL